MSLPGPRFLYVGTLDRRIDVALVGDVARRVPGASIVFLGPATDPEHVECLRRIPGVVIRPPADRATVVATVSAADACLLPHVVTPLTEGMSPLKVYEYLAGGRPVAAVDLPALHGIDDRVLLASGERFA